MRPIKFVILYSHCKYAFSHYRPACPVWKCYGRNYEECIHYSSWQSWQWQTDRGWDALWRRTEQSSSILVLVAWYRKFKCKVRLKSVETVMILLLGGTGPLLSLQVLVSGVARNWAEKKVNCCLTLSCKMRPAIGWESGDRGWGSVGHWGWAAF